MEAVTTQRGFRLIRFNDQYGKKCHLQESSIMLDEGCVWFGCNDIELKKFIPSKGWSDVDLEDNFPNGVGYVANTKMHLTQSQVRDLLPALQYFVDNGELPTTPPTEQG